jgi:hypothetical protein
MSQKSKINRTQIADLPETSVELTESDMRIVSGGLRSGIYGCSVRVASVSVSGFSDKTQYNTNGDWDTDW